MEQKVNLEQFEAGIASMPEVKRKKTMNAFDYGAIYQAKFRKSLENGTSPFLPKNGKVDLVGVYNMRTNELHRGITQIMLQEVKAELGVSTGGFVSAEVVQNARKQGVQTGMKQGSHGFDILVENKEKTEKQVIKWFHESQIDGVENLKTHLEQKMRKSAKDRQAFIVKKYPGGTARDASLAQTDRPNTKKMVCSAKSPDQYLGQILAGISTGTALLVSPETEALFKEKTMKILTREHKPGVKDKMGLLKLAASANTICKGTVKKMYEMKKENPKVEKKIEPEMGLGR